MATPVPGTSTGLLTAGAWAAAGFVATRAVDFFAGPAAEAESTDQIPQAAIIPNTKTPRVMSIPLQNDRTRESHSKGVSRGMGRPIKSGRGSQSSHRRLASPARLPSLPKHYGRTPGEDVENRDWLAPRPVTKPLDQAH
jgi:hypothetical protein